MVERSGVNIEGSIPIGTCNVGFGSVEVTWFTGVLKCSVSSGQGPSRRA
jgi:hypothetical protein